MLRTRLQQTVTLLPQAAPFSRPSSTFCRSIHQASTSAISNRRASLRTIKAVANMSSSTSKSNNNGNDNKRPRKSDDSSEGGSSGDDWKQQPPYAPEDPKKPKKAVFKGCCHCHDVTFEIYTKEPKGSHFCHCDTCQKLHGSAAHWSSVMPKTDVLFTCSTDKLSFYRTEDQKTEHILPCKLSCARCHSPIADEGRNMMLMYPSTFDWQNKEDREPFLPDRHIFYKQRCLEVEDGKDKWEGMADDSKKMDEEHHHGQKGTAGSGSKVRSPDKSKL